jgi:hypothetical protein
MCASTLDVPLDAKVRLVAEAADWATEVVLINHELRRVASGVGKLEGEFEPGFYKLKLVAGGQSEEKLVELEAGKGTIHIKAPPVRFESAVPLADSDAPAGQVDAAVEQSRQVHFRFRAGGKLFLFARDVKGREETEPWRGVSVSTPAGRHLFDLETHGFRSAASACGAVNASLEPGLYVLSVDTRVWGVQQMSVAVSPGWQTQVFLAARTLERSAPGGDTERSARRADLFTASISMVHENRGFEPERSAARLVEIARRSLERGRNIVQAGEFRKMLRGKFEDPMLGLLAGHLLLLSEEPDLALLGLIVKNLRRLKLAEHPDLRALELALAPPADELDFPLPPMLRASWHRIIAASAAATDLIPEGSLAFRVAPRVIGNAAWLVWRRVGPAEERRETRDARHGGKRSKGALERELRRLGDWIVEGLDRRATRGGSESLSLAREESDEARDPRLDFLENTLMAAVESAALASGLEPSVEQLVRTLGLPASNIEDLLGRVLRKKGLVGK